MLIRGTATDIVAMDTADTTGLMATMVTTERGLPMPSQSPLRPLTLTLMLMLGTDTMATDTVAGATMATMERGLQMLSLSLLLLLSPMLMPILGTATDTVATDGGATTGPMATMVTTERGLPMPSLSLLLLLSPILMLIPGMAMDTVDTDGVATTGLMATMATMERGRQMPSLLLMPGTATTATVAGDTVATTAHMDMGVTGEVTGAKQTNREVDSSSDCDFPSTLASISRACS